MESVSTVSYVNFVFVSSYKLQGRVAKLEFLDKYRLLVHTAPGASTDGAVSVQIVAVIGKKITWDVKKLF